jgi:glycosyltransferase involved in cell wall biosynthesis
VIRLLELRNTYKWGGGPDKTILLSAERHDPKRVSVVVAYIRDAADREFRIGEMARARGLTFYEIEERGKLDLRVVRAVRDIVRRHRIDIIHAHDYKSDLFAYLVGLSLGRRRPAIVSTAHAWVIVGRRGDLYRRLDLFLMRRFEQLVAVARSTKDEMVASGVPEEKIAVIHNAIDTDAWSPARVIESRRTEWGLTSAFPVVGYVGRIMPEKDLESWLRAAALLARKCPRARFVLVGDGRDATTRRELEALAGALGIEDRVLFSGYQSDLPPVYASFDVFMLSSRREGLPNSLLEAMAMRLPVVTTDVAGAKELVVDGETGFVRPQGDARGLGEALIALAGDDALRARLASASRHRVEHEFSFDRRLDLIESLYERVAASSHRVARIHAGVPV